MSEIDFLPDGSGIVLVMDGVAHSWVDLDDPTRLEFPYMLRLADYLDVVAPVGERMRVIHVGGGAMSMARYIADGRPTSPQIVLEPNEKLTEKVREYLPLPAHSGIKVRPVGGREGISAMPNDYAKVIIVDAFAATRVPASLVSTEFFNECFRVLTTEGLLLLNAIDTFPLDWAKRVLATIGQFADQLWLSAETQVLKGRRHGNLVFAASRRELNTDQIIRRAAGAAFPCRVLYGKSLHNFIAGAKPFHDDDAEDSPNIERGLLHFE